MSTSSAGDTAKLLRQARQAANRGDYADAQALYVQLYDSDSYKNDVDIALRLAYCAEQAGDFATAKNLYKKVAQEYQKSGEIGPAKAVEDILERMRVHMQRVKQQKQQKDKDKDKDKEEELVEFQDNELIELLFWRGTRRILEPGEVLCIEGDLPKQLWLLTIGILEVRLPQDEDVIELKGTPTLPCIIGELGYFTRQRRAATLIAKTRIEILELVDEDMQLLFERNPGFREGMERLFRERVFERMLARHAVFERINEIDRLRLALAFERVDIDAGQQLIGLQEENPYTYLMQAGCAFVTHTDDNEELVLAGAVFPGDLVHLGGLLDGFKGNYEVVAATPSTVLRLSRDIFNPFAERRPWIIPAIVKYSRKPATHQILHPDDEYRVAVNRHVKLSHGFSKSMETKETS
ncbi:MAG: cyclic nucleotide-binding domain-containing protein [Mariprofundales bacterium]